MHQLVPSFTMLTTVFHSETLFSCGHFFGALPFARSICLFFYYYFPGTIGLFFSFVLVISSINFSSGSSGRFSCREVAQVGKLFRQASAVPCQYDLWWQRTTLTCLDFSTPESGLRGVQMVILMAESESRCIHAHLVSFHFRCSGLLPLKF